MLCKWCGMESASKDQCSWCNRPLTSTTSEGGGDGQSVVPSNRPAISLRRPAHVQQLVEDSPEENEALPEIGSAPKSVASPTPTVPINPETTESDSHRIIGLKRPQPKLGQNQGFAQKPPPPTMPAPLPLRRPAPPGLPPSAKPGQTNQAAPVAPTPPTLRPHMPAPGVPTAHRGSSSQNAPEKSAAAPLPRIAPTNVVSSTGASQPAVGISSRPSIPANLLRPSTSVATAPRAYEEETGGLASGLSAPKPGSSVATLSNPNIPQLGTFTAEKSKYYSDQVIDPSSGVHYDSATGRPTNTNNNVSMAGEIQLHWDDEPQIPQSRMISRFLFVFACILVSVGVFSFAIRPSTYALMILCLIGSGMLMPIMRAAPWQRDDSDDLVWYLLFTVVFGPFIGLIFYGVMSLLRQSFNPAMVGCFLITIMTLLTVYIAAGGASTGVLFGPPWLQTGGVDLAKVLINGLTGLLPVVGWFLANFFHKLDE